MKFLCFGESQMLSIRVLTCDKFVNMYRMDTKSSLTSCTSSSTFGQLSCILREVEVTCVTGLYQLPQGLIRVGMLCLKPVEISCRSQAATSKLENGDG